MNIPAKVDANFERGMFGVDLVLNESEWEEGTLHLHFHPRLVATLTQEFQLERTGSMMDLLAKQFDADGRELGQQEFGKEMEKALGDVDSKGHKLLSGTELNVFGVVGRFKGDNSQSTKPGSLNNAIAICTPTGHKEITTIPATDCYIDWLAVNGSNRDITDITLQQLVLRFYQERTQGKNERKVWTPGTPL